MNIASCLGLTKLIDDEKKIDRFIRSTVKDGKILEGYSGNVTINNWFGNLQIIHNALKQPDGNYTITDSYLHSTGNALWHFRVHPGSIDPPDYTELEKRVLITRADGTGGMGVLDLLNADVLPGWDEGEAITAQVIAYPVEIHYYPDEDAFAADQKTPQNEKPLLLADGTVFPSVFLQNHSPENIREDEQGIENDWSDGIVLIRGTVKGIRQGYFALPEREDKLHLFNRVVIDTQFGELEIVHTSDQVSEEELPLIKAGATVFGAFMVYGDCAIYEYENGIVRDEEHDLRLLKNVLSGSCKAERLGAVLTDESVYLSEHSGYKAFTGRDEILKRILHIQELNPGKKYYTSLATITRVDEGETELPYGPGKRCVTLAENDPNKIQSVSFIDTDDKGNILHLTISKESRYHFRQDISPLQDYTPSPADSDECE